MIELNEKTQQDFLNREWVQKLMDAGVDMSDAKYFIENNPNSDKIWIIDKDTVDKIKQKSISAIILPTYTVSELLYKLHEWIYPTINGTKYSGGLTFIKDAPFYIWYYQLTDDNGSGIAENFVDDYISAKAEYPIESLASILIQCHKKGIGDIGNISDK